MKKMLRDNHVNTFFSASGHEAQVMEHIAYGRRTTPLDCLIYAFKFVI